MTPWRPLPEVRSAALTALDDLEAEIGREVDEPALAMAGRQWLVILPWIALRDLIPPGQ